MKLHEKISRLRQNQSPESVAAEVGCAGTTIRRIEAGVQEPKVGLALKLAELFGVSLDWLADERLPWPPPHLTSPAVRTGPEKPESPGALSPAERELIHSWRALRPELQGRLMGYMAGLSQVTAHKRGSAPQDSAGQSPRRPEV